MVQRPRLTPQYSERLEVYAEEFGVILATANMILSVVGIVEMRKNYNPDGTAKDASLQEVWAPLRKRMDFFAKLNPIYRAGLGQTHYCAEFEYWGRMERLELDEILWLSMGLDPRTSWDEELRLNKKTPGREHREKAHALSLREQLGRFAEAQPRGRSDLEACELLSWIRSTDFPAHSGLVLVLETIARRKVGEGVPARTSPTYHTDPREIDSMAKILTAIAIREYGYVPGKASPIPKEIEGICDELGLSVSNETIRKYLRHGAKMLPKKE